MQSAGKRTTRRADTNAEAATQRRSHAGRLEFDPDTDTALSMLEPCIAEQPLAFAECKADTLRSTICRSP